MKAKCIDNYPLCVVFRSFKSRYFGVYLNLSISIEEDKKVGEEMVFSFEGVSHLDNLKLVMKVRKTREKGV